MPKISPLTHKLIKEISRAKKDGSAKKEEPSSKRGFLFTARQKLIKNLPWREKHYLRRKVIKKALRQKYYKDKKIRDRISFEFTREVVGDILSYGHFERTAATDQELEKIQKTLEDHATLIKKIPERISKEKGLQNWILSIISCEIEEVLSPSIKERMLIFYMFNSLKNELAPGESEEKKEVLLHTAVQRALFGLDGVTIGYHMMRSKYSEIEDPEKRVEKISENPYKERQAVSRIFKEKYFQFFYRYCKSRRTPFLIIGDLVNENPGEIKETLQDPQETEEAIKKIYQRKKKKKGKELHRSMIHYVLLLFVLRILLLLVIEYPLFKFSAMELTFQNTVIGTLTPPLIVLLVVLTLPPTPKKSEKKAILEVMNIIYKKERNQKSLSKKGKERAILFIDLLYGISFLMLAGAIIWSLFHIGIPLLSSLILILFLSLSAIFSLDIREKNRDLAMTKKKGGPFFLVLEILGFPLMCLRKWLTIREEEQNSLSLFSNIIITLPTGTISEIGREWKEQLKEKKERIYE